MSSFRPDRPYHSCEFRPSLLIGDGGSEFVHGPEDSALVLAVDADGQHETTLVQDGSGQNALTEWTPERLEAFEQAAFDRGVASAREASDALARSCAVLEASAAQLKIVVSTSVVTNRELILSLAMEISEKWVAAELTLDPSLFGRALDRAIESCERIDGACLVLHPMDRETLISTQAERVALWSRDHALTIEEDASLESGMFRIEAGCQSVDGRFEAIRARLRDALSEAFEADLPEGAV